MQKKLTQLWHEAQVFRDLKKKKILVHICVNYIHSNRHSSDREQLSLPPIFQLSAVIWVCVEEGIPRKNCYAQLILLFTDSSERNDRTHRFGTVQLVLGWAFSLKGLLWKSPHQRSLRDPVRQLPGWPTLCTEWTEYVFMEQLHPPGRCMKKSKSAGEVRLPSSHIHS